MKAVAFRSHIGVRSGRRAYSSQGDFVAAVRESMNRVIDNFKEWTKHIDEQSANVLEDALRPTFDWSQEIVPYRTGELHDSGYLETNSTRGKARVEIGYAKGGQPSYAIVVHEDLHAGHESPRQAKFLQMPLEADEQDIMERVREGLRYAAGING